MFKAAADLSRLVGKKALEEVRQVPVDQTGDRRQEFLSARVPVRVRLELHGGGPLVRDMSEIPTDARQARCSIRLMHEEVTGVRPTTSAFDNDAPAALDWRTGHSPRG